MGSNVRQHQLASHAIGQPVFMISSDLCFMAEQYSRFGAVSNSMVAVTLLHALYTVDFFVNEAW